MRAVVVTEPGGPEVLQVQELPEPTPGPGQVQIRVAATGVNFADIMARRGRYHGAPSGGGFVPGLDVAGTITALGEGVAGLSVGQRVAAFPAGGSYAEVVVADPVMVYPLPDNVDFETAAAFPTIGVTAYNLLKTVGRLGEGETVLVHAAAGGVGTTAVQAARLLGAGRVFGTVGDDAKAGVVRDLGADAVINYRQEEFAPRVRALTGDAGADVVLDSVAGPVTAASMSCLAPFGRLVVFGQASGEPGQVPTSEFYPLNRAVLGYSTGGYRRLRPAGLRPAAEAVLDWLAAGRLQIVIGRRYPLAEAAEAQRFVESRASTGKVLLLP
ncbi:MAG TPA: quinone oxidoreductase [Chloroflexota bacterium]|jgi:NADPH2:quinone reductase